MNSAAESRFRIPAPPTHRRVNVIDFDTATAADVDRLLTAAADADLVVMLVSAGGDAQAAATIGAACSKQHVMTHAIVRAGGRTGAALSRTLAQLRPWSLMVVVATADDYVEDILRSFR